MTRYGDKLKRHVLETQGLKGVIAIETHLDEQRGVSERSFWSKHGWDAQFAPGQWDDTLADAQQTEGKGRPQGGVLMMLRNHLRADDLSRVLADLGAEDLTAKILHVKGEQILLVGGYLRPGIGIKGANLPRLQRLAAVVGAWRGSWLTYMD